MVIWSLFDSENDTVKNALSHLDVEVYSFGIGCGTGHIHLDLSDFEFARRELDKYPNPDIVFASPPCETWCYVSVGCKRHYTTELGINLYWKNKWTPFDFTSKYIDRRKNGVATLETMFKIIEWYEPKYWFIENGTRSLAFAYLKEVLGLTGFKNLTNYYSYNFNYLKPTTIYSNILLQLRNNSPNTELAKLENHISGYTKFELSKLRSKVPAGLYLDIYKQAKVGGVPLLNFPSEKN